MPILLNHRVLHALSQPLYLRSSTPQKTAHIIVVHIFVQLKTTSTYHIHINNYYVKVICTMHLGYNNNSENAVCETDEGTLKQKSFVLKVGFFEFFCTSVLNVTASLVSV